MLWTLLTIGDNLAKKIRLHSKYWFNKDQRATGALAPGTNPWGGGLQKAAAMLPCTQLCPRVLKPLPLNQINCIKAMQKGHM